MPGCISSSDLLPANAGRRQTKTLSEDVLPSLLAERKEEDVMASSGATTMTVRAMGALLGLKKTESYYLVNKKLFDTVVIAGQLRVVRASFEEWYALQDWYKKVDGDPPGAALHENMYSIRDIQKILGLANESVRELIHREKLLTLTLEGKFWVPKVIFDDWYASQSRYRNMKDREKDRATEEASMTVPEMGKMIGLDPRQAWKLYYEHRNELKLIRIADRPRITKASFLYWLEGQKTYHVNADKYCPKQENEKEFMTVSEAAKLLNVGAQRIYRALQSNKAEGKKIGRIWYFKYADILSALSEEG